MESQTAYEDKVDDENNLSINHNNPTFKIRMEGNIENKKISSI